jgi:hypothetical protein
MEQRQCKVGLDVFIDSSKTLFVQSANPARRNTRLNANGDNSDFGHK